MSGAKHAVRVLVALALAAVLIGGAHPAAAAAWEYGVIHDDMEGRDTGKYATTTAVNPLNLRFPYGLTVPTLTVTNTVFQIAVTLELPKGRLTSGHTMIKFDDGPTTDLGNFGGYTGRDYRTMTFGGGSTFAGGRKFMALYGKAKRMKVQIWIYDNGAQVVEFDLTGLNPAMLVPQPKKKANVEKKRADHHVGDTAAVRTDREKIMADREKMRQERIDKKAAETK